MRHDFGQLKTSCNVGNDKLYTEMPSLIAALAIGDEVFFSSQLRGTSAYAFVYADLADAAIRDQLNLW